MKGELPYFYTIRVKAHEYVLVKEPVPNGLFKAGIANFYMFSSAKAATEFLKNRKDYDPTKNIVVDSRKFDAELNKMKGGY